MYAWDTRLKFSDRFTTKECVNIRLMYFHRAHWYYVWKSKILLGSMAFIVRGVCPCALSIYIQGLLLGLALTLRGLGMIIKVMGSERVLILVLVILYLWPTSCSRASHH